MIAKALVVVCTLAGTCPAQPDPEARQKLELAQDAVEQLDTLSYALTFRAEGLFNLNHEVNSEVRMMRDPEQRDRWSVRWSGRAQMPGLDPVEFLMSTDGVNMTWVNHKTREWHKRNKAAARGETMDLLAFAWIDELAEPRPFQSHIDASTIRSEPAMEIDGVPVDVVYVEAGKGQPKRWSLGREDRLPHRLEWVFSGEGITGKWVFDVKALAVNTPMTAQDFEIAVPDGYTAKDSTVVAPAPAPTPGDRTTTTPGDRTSTTTRPPARTVGTEVGNLAPDFELARARVDGASPGGERVSLASLKGGIVVLDFFGSWNVQSRNAAPQLKELAERYKDRGVKWASLAVRERDDQKPIDFMKENGLDWTLLLQADDVAKMYKVRVYPTYFVIDREGVIAHVALGFDREKTGPAIAEAIEKLLAAAPATVTPSGAEGDDGGK